VIVSALFRLVRQIGGEPWFAVVGGALVPLDRFLGKRTKGRFGALRLVDLPFLMLTTTGRRSGRARSHPLLYAGDGDAFVVIGSNWGKKHHPAWSGNLLAHPEAIVTLHGKDIPVRARLTDGAERERLEGLLRAMWPAYVTYERRAGGRELRIFRLERED
jgi:deazaflavin-dependent oxidoreductase (nitroreductase family)